MSRSARWIWRAAAALLALTLLLGLLVAWLNVRGESDASVASAPVPSPALVERGAYLARAGNCVGCHTAIGGAPFAGGHGVETPFGAVMAPNITPDLQTGIGSWTANDFWRAMHHGRSKDGRLLYPAFPYPSFTQVTREDSDALFVYLRSLPAVNKVNESHALRFPYSSQAALAVWRALFFKPVSFQPEPQQSVEWNRGKYLVQGLGHCAACHTGRNFLGGTGLNAEFGGGLMPDASWYAPSLASPAEGGVQQWTRQEVVRLLKTGLSAEASVSGPMAEVVFASTQHLSERDLAAMADYLATLPQHEPPAPGRSKPRMADETLLQGARIYKEQCASCHGRQGQGVAGIYPRLAGNRAVTLASANNVVQIIRRGGFLPSTAGNPQPFGMPPFGQTLSDAETAAVASFIRQAWGNAGQPVSTLEVMRIR
ncbi:cytochrome c [Pelomonas sp. V22]|uniref:c-type cytochrome n=1 Tax=Pelomonas sp. V22 TaxID=2822139 RepID=UPI0024A7B49B|nr:cytochrome c [Pelomonas sp. V22]MDI4632897.1 cytochrome c [Pelomonas sp. V22]